MDAIATIRAMRRQEDSAYVAADYFGRRALKRPLSESVTMESRNKMAAWCLQVTDFCKFNRETAAIAMSYVDRFMMTPQGQAAGNDIKSFQLASMTSLYVAVKIHEPEALTPELISNFSRGTYTEADIEAMEMTICSALKWRLNPPTALAFVRHLLSLTPKEVTPVMQQTAHDIAKLQIELSVGDYDFVTTKASTVAFGALMISLESLGLDVKVLTRIGSVLAEVIGISCYDDHVLDVQDRLYKKIVEHSQGGINMVQTRIRRTQKFSRRASLEASPVSVSSGMRF